MDINKKKNTSKRRLLTLEGAKIPVTQEICVLVLQTIPKMAFEPEQVRSLYAVELNDFRIM